MNPMGVCKYIAREFGVVLKNDETGLHVRIGRCYCTVTDKEWSLRKVRRITKGTSAIVLLMEIHKQSKLKLDVLSAMMLVRDIEAHLAKQ